MNKDDNDTILDKTILIMRRLFVLLFLGTIIWLVLSKIIWSKNNKQPINTDVLKTGQIVDINIEDNEATYNQTWVTIINLGKHYESQSWQIMYKWEIVKFADSKTFKVINKNEINQSVINSNNLLKIFADYETRVYLMKNIDNIIKNKENVTDQLKKSSENGMYKMKNEYNILSEFDRGDRYDMTNEQRAKFAIMFLYIKIVKAHSNDRITTKKALNELKIFLENFNENDLKKEVEAKGLDRIKWDLWIDNDCLYVNGELYACFLDGLFVR